VTAKTPEHVKSLEEWQALQLALHTFNQSKRTQDDIKQALGKIDSNWESVDARFAPKRAGVLVLSGITRLLSYWILIECLWVVQRPVLSCP
jgi:hypothetical protein